MSLEDEIRRLAIAIETLIRKTFPGPPKPGLLSFRVTAERHQQVGDEIVDFLTFEVDVPSAELNDDGSPTDVVKRVVEVTLPDGTVQSSEIEGNLAGTVTGFEVPQGSLVTVSCVNVDDAGLESDAREQEFTINDTIPPAQPGELVVRVTGERHE